jgi:hypothetical protein
MYTYIYIHTYIYIYIYKLFFSVAQQPNSDPGHFIVEVSRSKIHARTHAHTHTHTQPVGLLWTSDQSVAEAATCTTHNKHKRSTPMPTARFETATPEIKRPQTYALEPPPHTHTYIFIYIYTRTHGIRSQKTYVIINIYLRHQTR